MSASAAPALSSRQRLIRVRELWVLSQKDQLEIGRLLYEERAERLGVGGRGDREGFHQWLREAAIPKTSAYRRISEYEISVGQRTEDDPFDKPAKPVPTGTTFIASQQKIARTNNADVVQVEQVTTRDQMACRSDPSAPLSEVRHWSPDQERRKNRSTPVNDFEELRRLAVKMLIAGYKELKTTGEYDNSHLYAAREWAQLSIADAGIVQ
jgi:hypothetical protein